MKLTIFFTALISWIVISKLVFQKVRGDYKEIGKLSKLTSHLQIVIFALHAQLFTFSYWNLSLFPADKYLSVAYWFYTAPKFSGSLVSLLIGCCLAIAGILVLGLGFRELGAFERAKGRLVDRLITKGIYRITRNPQLVGYGLIVLSVPFFWNSLLAFIAALVYWLGARTMVMAEEEHLNRVFDQDYNDYCERTPRYLGAFRERRKLV